MAAKGTSGGVIGGACTVSDGPNKGKQGTYTVDDEGNVWCEGDWGGTQCFAHCEDAVSLHGSVFEYTDTDGEVVYEFDHLYEVEGAGVFRCKMKIEAKSGQARYAAAVPVGATPLSVLRKSDSDLDRRLAEIIEKQVSSRTKGDG